MLAGWQTNDLLGRSAQLIGAGLFKKWETGVKLLQGLSAASGQDEAVLLEAVSQKKHHTTLKLLELSFIAGGFVLGSRETTARTSGRGESRG